jgi:hypothetical protein
LHWALIALGAAMSFLAPPLISQAVLIGPATETTIPFRVDGNSPALWRDGRLLFFTSDGNPVVAQGTDQFQLGHPESVVVEPSDERSLWFESVWQDSDGTIFGWYHSEPNNVCPGGKLTAPMIGAAVSYDGGKTFNDLGYVLASGDLVDCQAQNGFFAGGHGDFSVILDRNQQYFYFFFTNYGGAVSRQGIAMARMAFEDRGHPAGAVFKYADGAWQEPGIGGRVTPIFPARTSWQRPDTDSFWGPAIHWNTHLEKYVILLNRACCEPDWPQAGIHITFNEDLGNPARWSAPKMILYDIPYGPGFYPQVLGLDPDTTDTIVGEKARLYVQGASRWEIVFVRQEDVDDVLPDEPPSVEPGTVQP